MSNKKSDEKKEFRNEIRKFVTYMIYDLNFSAASISRAIQQTDCNNIKNRTFGYKKAVLIKNAYINNYNKWVLLKQNKEL